MAGHAHIIGNSVSGERYRATMVLLFFQVREKSGNFVDGQGNLERTLKVREKSGNLKMAMTGYLWETSLFCSRGERMYFFMR